MGNRKELSREAVQSLSDNRGRGVTQVSKSTFYRMCRKYEVPYKTIKSPYRVTEEEEKTMASLSRQKVSHREIGEQFNISHTSVGRRLRRRASGKKPRQTVNQPPN